MSVILNYLLPGRDDGNVDARLRHRLGFLAGTAISMSVMMLLLLCLVMIKFGLGAFFYAAALMAILPLASLACLRGHRHALAASLISLSLMGISCAVIFLMPYKGNNPSELYRAAAFVEAMAAVNAVAALRKRQIWFFFGLFACAWIGAAFSVFRGYSLSGDSGALVSLVVAALGVLFASVMLSLLRRLSDMTLDLADQRSRESEASLSRLRRILAEAKGSMDIGERLLGASGASQKAVDGVHETQTFLSDESRRLLQELGVLAEGGRLVSEGAASMALQLEAQSRAISESSLAIERMAQASAGVSQVASERRHGLEEAATAAAERTRLISALEASFALVSQSSSGITQFLDTVEDIAERTSLLSMNASIESARAGQAGKGFSVIAQEIRSLSEETRRNADRIRDVLASNGQTVLDTGALVARLGSFLAQDAKATESLISSMEEIIVGISQTSAGADELLNVMGRLVSGNGQTSGLVADVVSRLSVQGRAIEGLEAFARGLDDRIKVLSEAVAQIRLSGQAVAEAARLNVEQVRRLQDE